MRVTVIDIETDGLLPQLTKIHVMGWWTTGDKEVQTTTCLNKMREVIESSDVLVGHNFYMFDSIVLEDFLGIKIDRVIDTLALSNYLRQARIMHGLDSYQEEVGIAKVEVANWVDGSIELYEERVTEDVKINTNLFFIFMKELKKLYGDKADRFALLLSSYYSDYKEHYRNPFKVDLPLMIDSIDKLSGLVNNRLTELVSVMPKIETEIYKPSKFYKKDGTLSVAGSKFILALEENGYPLDATKYSTFVPPNPASPVQVKDWLLGLGWKPETFKDGANGPVPQVKNKDGDLCVSVIDLDIPETRVLEDLSVLSNRLSNVKRMDKFKVDGYLAADIGGLTNTLRIKHRTLVNITKVKALHGEYERTLLTCDDDEVLVGADLSSLENYTRTNFICDLNPRAVDELLDPDFDTHLDIALFANILTKEDCDTYKKLKANYDNLSEEELKVYLSIDTIRDMAKTVNYSALYGIGAKKLSKDLKIVLRKAQRLLDAYWEKHFAVRLFENNLRIEEIGGLNWIKNPLNGIYYPVRSVKDKFSLINQSAGAYIFKLWIDEIRKRGVKLTAQFHDEIIARVKLTEVDKVKLIIAESLIEVNNSLSLRIPIGCNIKTGKYYSQIH